MDFNACALICAYNEQDTIVETASKALHYVPTIVVDDGSSDKTAEYARSTGANVISHPENKGKGAALKTGFDVFFDSPFDQIVTLDADLQHLPEDIPKFIGKLCKGYDAVIGNRDFSDPCVPKARKIGNTLDSKILSTILKKPIHDPQNGFRAFHKNVLRDVASDIQNVGFPYELELLIGLARKDYDIGWQEIPTIYMEDRKSHIKPGKHIMDSVNLYLKCLTKRI